ncbi:necrosis-and ethylene-inducing protein-like protein 1 precursor [Apiospora arundinis]
MRLCMCLKAFELAFLAAATLAYPIQQRDAIGNGNIVGLPESVPSNAAGELYLKYKPYLLRDSGCVPYPAVDSQGNTNEGLEPKGGPSADCLSSTGQIYARAATVNGSHGIMYAWYWPKDEPSEWESWLGIGHRHDWESVVVWLSSNAPDATVLGVAASGHGKYTSTKSPPFHNSSVLIKYYSIAGLLDHSLGFTASIGQQQPLIAWESMSSVVQDALSTTDFGAATVPFIDSEFQKHLDNAAL